MCKGNKRASCIRLPTQTLIDAARDHFGTQCIVKTLWETYRPDLGGREDLMGADQVLIIYNEIDFFILFSSKEW